jgi:hypothetical protein
VAVEHNKKQICKELACGYKKIGGKDSIYFNYKNNFVRINEKSPF